jgi:hypothetical protein
MAYPSWREIFLQAFFLGLVVMTIGDGNLARKDHPKFAMFLIGTFTSFIGVCVFTFAFILVKEAYIKLRYNNLTKRLQPVADFVLGSS